MKRDRQAEDREPRYEFANVSEARVRVWGAFGVRVLEPGEKAEFEMLKPIAGFYLEPAPT